MIGNAFVRKRRFQEGDPSRTKMLVWIIVLNIGTFLFIYLFFKVKDPEKLREKYYKKRGFKADIICLLPLESLSSLLFCKYFKTVPYFCLDFGWTLHILLVKSVIDTNLCFDVIEWSLRDILSSTYILNILCSMTSKRQ